MLDKQREIVQNGRMTTNDSIEVLDLWLTHSRVPNATVAALLCREHGGIDGALREVEISIQVILDGHGAEGDEASLPDLRSLLAYMRGCAQ